MDLEALGDNIRYYRKAKKITQEDLADVIGVSRTAVARWELNEIEPKLINLICLADYLEVSIDSLLGRKKYFDYESRRKYEAIKRIVEG